MASAIIGGGLKLLGIGKKKKAADPASTADKRGPIVTPLTGGSLPPNLRRRLVTAQPAAPTLGSAGKLGG